MMCFFVCVQNQNHFIVSTHPPIHPSPIPPTPKPHTPTIHRSNCYSSYAVMVDEFMYNNPDALVVFAAGNSGTQGDYSVGVSVCFFVGDIYIFLYARLLGALR